MIEKLSLLLLRCAAVRWRDDGQMLAEWRAELFTVDSAKDRLSYALSLAVSPPHRARALPSARRLPAVVASLLLLLALPVGYSGIAGRWRAYPSSDTVSWQLLSASAAIAGAVALGVGCARLTAGLTRVIKPMLLSSWVFGMPVLLCLPLIGSTATRTGFIGLCAWLVGAIACGIVVVRLTVHGHAAIAWGVVAIAAPVVFLLATLHGIIGFFDGRYQLSVRDPLFAAMVFALANQPFLHLTCFGFAYTRSLAAKYR